VIWFLTRSLVKRIIRERKFKETLSHYRTICKHSSCTNMEWNAPVSQGVCIGMSYFKCDKGTVSRLYDNVNVSMFVNT
jgi:hypothetical protein